MSVPQLFRCLACFMSLTTAAVRSGVAADSAEPETTAQDEKAGTKENTAKAETEAEKPVYGDTMVVTASRTEEEVAKAPVAITVVRFEELATSPADNYADLLLWDALPINFDEVKIISR